MFLTGPPSKLSDCALVAGVSWSREVLECIDGGRLTEAMGIPLSMLDFSGVQLCWGHPSSGSKLNKLTGPPGRTSVELHFGLLLSALSEEGEMYSHFLLEKFSSVSHHS